MASPPAVLLVDDDSRVLSALQRCLRREPFDLAIASDGEAALELLSERSFDLVISDQKMPGMSGLELLTIVRQKWPSAARVMLTGWSGEIDPMALKAAGLFATLPKPWDDGELRETIRRALDSE
ncbi:MAG: response regulator [Myxococcota bacterium]